MDILNLSNIAELNKKIDNEVDEIYKVEINKNKNIIFEGRLAAFMVDKIYKKKSLKIWMKAPIDIRVKRIMNREKSLEYNKEKENTIIREESERNRYNKYYNINIEDLSIYDIIIDTKTLTPKQIFNILETYIENYFKNENINE